MCVSPLTQGKTIRFRGEGTEGEQLGMPVDLAEEGKPALRIFVKMLLSYM